MSAKRVIIAGATGMIGGLILRNCLENENVSEVKVIGRRPVGIRNPKLSAVLHDDYSDYSAVGDLEAPLGTFAMPGNHDVCAGWDAVRQRMSAAGFKVLVNESAPIERDGQRLWVAGTGDPAGQGWQRDGGSGLRLRLPW